MSIAIKVTKSIKIYTYFFHKTFIVIYISDKPIKKELH